MNELTQKSAGELAYLIKRKEVSSKEVVEALSSVSEVPLVVEVNPELQAEELELLSHEMELSDVEDAALHQHLLAEQPARRQPLGLLRVAQGAGVGGALGALLLLLLLLQLVLRQLQQPRVLLEALVGQDRALALAAEDGGCEVIKERRGDGHVFGEHCKGVEEVDDTLTFRPRVGRER